MLAEIRCALRPHRGDAGDLDGVGHEHRHRDLRVVGTGRHLVDENLLVGRRLFDDGDAVHGDVELFEDGKPRVRCSRLHGLGDGIAEFAAVAP